MRVCASISCISMLPPVKKDRVITQNEAFYSTNVKKIFVLPFLVCHLSPVALRFCKGAFEKNYKATIGVDFEMERFEVLDVPFSLQLWDTAGQERFKCIASTYYRGAQADKMYVRVYVCASRQWLEDAMKENDPSSVLLFLVGTKKDLSSPDLLAQIEQEAMRLSEEIKAEYWAVSAKSGDGVKDFFFRVASLTFEANVLSDVILTVQNTIENCCYNIMR
uniref:Ras-related protein Rab-34-like n=1 Tax=Pundamilia nyererei TaxID=303518 RepID=A0A3B4GIE0_9CICH